MVVASRSRRDALPEHTVYRVDAVCEGCNHRVLDCPLPACPLEMGRDVARRMERRQRVAALAKTGMTARAIARQLGLPYRTVARDVVALGLR